MAKKISSANGQPNKSFFVRMITRDITLEDCILDLIDNSVDSAWKAEGGQPAELNAKADLSKYWINIVLNEDEFAISDNCGGIPLTEAKDYAFTFGRRDADDGDDFSIGVYGIGMKRAVFKMGRAISVRSTYSTAGALKGFEVPIIVDDWLKPENAAEWDFPIYEAKAGKEAGLQLRVQDLTDDTKAEFSNPIFARELAKILGRDYTLHLHYGIRILLNGKAISGASLQLRTGGAFQPIRMHRTIPAGKGSVRIEIIAGMGGPPPETNNADEAQGDERWGWYIICNGRVVLAGDKTFASGWGTEQWPQWHGQYNGFVGIVLFSSPDAELLPLTTTKRSVDTSSAVFRSARPNMRDLSKQWIAYTNARKPVVEDVKKLEDQTQSVPIYQIKAHSTMELPTISVPKKPKEQVANINYSVPLARFRKLAAAMDEPTITYRDLGVKAFEYAYRDYVGRK